MVQNRMALVFLHHQIVGSNKIGEFFLCLDGQFYVGFDFFFGLTPNSDYDVNKVDKARVGFDVVGFELLQHFELVVSAYDHALARFVEVVQIVKVEALQLEHGHVLLH